MVCGNTVNETRKVFEILDPRVHISRNLSELFVRRIGKFLYPPPLCVGALNGSPPYPFWPLLLEEPPDAPPAEADDGEDDHGEQGDDHPAMEMKVVKVHIQF